MGIITWRFFRYVCILKIIFMFRASSQLGLKVQYELIEDLGDDNVQFDHVIVRRAAAGSNGSSNATQTPPPVTSTPYTPVTSTPYTSTPVTSTPYTSTPDTSTPDTSTPYTSTPDTSTPDTSTPDTSTPDTSTPDTSTPDTSTPDTSTTDFPTTDFPTTDFPTTDFPAAEGPTTYNESNHKYYKSRYYSNGRKWWYDLDREKSPMFHLELSKNIKFSDTITTSFTFPYYGHQINNVTITNKGYVFLGERLHKFNASAQYAAPLMADFGADLHENTKIHYVDTGNRFTVEWSDLKLRKQEAAGFSFQCSILENGTLVFAYKKIPIAVPNLSSLNFPVRVGLSDTYRRDEYKHGRVTINGKTYSGIHYIYYYLYDKVKLSKVNVVDNSAFVLIPVPNCVMFNSCNTCVGVKTEFSCRWCAKLGRCSDGIDRYRAKWLHAGCDKQSITRCSNSSKNEEMKDSKISGGEIVLIVLIPLAVIVSLCGFYIFAYLHPQSKSGMLLIRYGNPMKWCRSSTSETTTEDAGTSSTGRGGKITFKTMPFESDT